MQGRCLVVSSGSGSLLWGSMLLPDVDHMHGLKVHEQKVSFTGQCQGEGHHNGPHLQLSAQERTLSGKDFQGEDT